jgi:hypothetical protein
MSEVNKKIKFIEKSLKNIKNKWKDMENYFYYFKLISNK